MTKADESDKPYPDNMKPKDNTPDTQPPPKNDTGPPEDNSKPSNPFDQQPKNTDSDN